MHDLNMNSLLPANMAEHSARLDMAAMVQKLKGNSIRMEDRCKPEKSTHHRIFGKNMTIAEISMCTKVSVNVLHNWRARGQLADKLRPYRELIAGWV